MAKAIQGSNSIEGFKATLDDAAAVEVGEQPLDADEETRLALEGYRNAMTYVLQALLLVVIARRREVARAARASGCCQSAGSPARTAT
jgi:hypothetical protein